MKLLLLVITTVWAQTTTEIPEPTTIIPTPFPTNDTIDPSVVRGQRAQLNEIPWQAFLIEHTSGGESYCGGSLIRPTWVITAAHCIHTPGAQTQVRLGGVNRNQMPYAQMANLRIIHSGYNFPTLENDVGLVRLPRPASGNTIALIPMAAQGSATLDGVPVRASGYGRTYDGSPVSQDLLKADLRVISNAECHQWFMNQPARVVPSTLCAAPATNVKQSVCHGDSGGPLTFSDQKGQPILVGIASFINAQVGCEQGHPQGFARVSSFSSWANDQINRNGG